MLCLAAAGNASAAVSPGLTVVSGTGQIVFEQFITTVPMVVQARDANGNPAANVTVTWKITQGQGTVRGGDTRVDDNGVVTGRTDANGVTTAQFLATVLPFGYSFQPQTVTASSSLGTANFYMTTVISRLSDGGLAQPPQPEVISPPLDNRDLAGKAGATIKGAYQLRVIAVSGPQQGHGVPNVGIRIVDATNVSGPAPASCVGTPLTDANGLLSCDLVLTGTPGTYIIAADIGESRITYASNLTITTGDVCAFTLSPPAATAGSSGGTGVFSVTTGTNCGWTATSSTNWLTITAGANGNGSGSVTYAVSPNAGSQRQGLIRVGGSTFTITQSQPGSGAGLTITTGSTLPAAIVNTSYAVTIAANGGSQPYSFTALTQLPAGLALNSQTGVITGAIATAGSYSFTIKAADAAGQTQSQNFTLSVVQQGGNGTLSFKTVFPNGAIGTAYGPVGLNASGGCLGLFTPGVFTLIAGSLPPGLSLVGGNTIAGTPTTNGSYSFSLQVKDNCANTGVASFVLVIGTGGGGGGGGGNGNVAFTVAPTQAQFTLQIGSATPATQNVALTSNIPAQFSIQVQMNSAATFNWLTVSPSAGTTPGTLTISASPAGLPGGTYVGVVTVVVAGGASGLPVMIPVTLRVTPPPSISVLPTSLSFLYQPGLPPSGSQILDVASTGIPLDYTVVATTDTGGPWLFSAPATSTTPSLLTVAVNPLGLASGVYKGSLVLRPNQAGVAPITIPVTLTIPQGAPLITSVTNAASFLPGPVSAGEIVTVFGSALGPQDLIPAHLTPAGLIDTVAGATRVLFDGLPSPMLYTSSGQVSAIVPYAITGRASTSMTVEYRGAASAPISLRVADSVPGIFLASSGGQAAAANQDGSTNTAQSGADPGSIIALYMTGEGQTDPAGIDGKLMTDILAKPLLGVTAQVNGKDAPVLYAGSAPTLAAGLMQINIQLPIDLPHGVNASVVVTIGRAASQSGVTVFVK